MSIVGTKTGFNDNQLSTDIGNQFISKDYLLDVYPHLIPSEARDNPGLWAWGHNSYGEATGDILHRSSPVQVGSLTDWKIISVWYHSCAIKKDLTLWAWGLSGLHSIRSILGKTALPAKEILGEQLNNNFIKLGNII